MQNTPKSLRFPLQLNPTGGFAFSDVSTELHERLEALLRTTVGDMAWRPAYGSDLSQLLVLPLTTEKVQEIASAVRVAVQSNEPDLRLRRVEVTPLPNEARIVIDMRLGLPTGVDRQVRISLEIPLPVREEVIGIT